MNKQDYMFTYSGIKFYPLEPTLDMFDLEDIARGLSHENRGCGQTDFPLSVAQHSVNVAMVLKELGYGVRTQFIGLCHDISEAYIKDIPTPVKELLPLYRQIENRIQELAYEWAGLGEVTPQDYEPVHWVDRELFYFEAQFLMPNADYPFNPIFKDMIIIPWSPEKAREEYIKLFKELREKL